MHFKIKIVDKINITLNFQIYNSNNFTDVTETEIYLIKFKDDVQVSFT